MMIFCFGGEVGAQYPRIIIIIIIKRLLHYRFPIGRLMEVKNRGLAFS